MTVVPTDTNPPYIPYEKSQPAEWRSGLFGCCDEGCGTCMYGFCCPGCAAGSARSDYDGSNCCFNTCCIGIAGNYNILREGYGIQGNCVGDVCKVLWCTPCAATQMLNQPKDKNNWKKAGSGKWQHGLCDICAAGPCICLLSFLECAPCVGASARTNFDSSNWCFNCCCLTPCANYNIIREGSGIEGNCAGDFCKMCFCGPCATIQMYSQAPQ